MKIEAYFRSLSDECDTLKNRVRMLIEGNHWPTDGEWKESVLRSMIRRSAPESVTVGRGFVVDHERCSTQIDVLVYDNNLPVLYKEGDLVFITPASCRAIVEVKSQLNITEFKTAAKRLADDAEFVRQNGMGIPLFAGLFSYDFQSPNSVNLLQAVQDIADRKELRIIDHAALGASMFIKYWETRPGAKDIEQYNHWHLYDLERMSFGYFIHNLLVTVCRHPVPRRELPWFPTESKEVHLLHSLEFESL